MKLSLASQQSIYLIGLYLALMILWLMVGDVALDLLYPTPSNSDFNWKSGIYILVTAGLLFLLIYQIRKQRLSTRQGELDIARHYLDVSAMAPVGIFSAEIPGMATYVNDRAGALIGVPAEQMVGSGWQSWIHEEDRARLLNTWGTALEQGDTISADFRMRHTNGSIIWVHGMASPLYDDDGRITGFLGMLADITEQKTGVLIRDEYQQQLQLAVDAAHIGFWNRNLCTDEVYYSPEWKRHIGYGVDEISNSLDEWRRRVHPGDLERAMTMVQRLIDTGTGKLHLEYRIQHRDGSYRWMFVQGSVFCDTDGTPLRLLGANVDITDRKMNEISLQEALQRNRELTELSPIGIYHTDAANQVTYVNTTMVKLLGAKLPQDLLGDARIAFIHIEDRDRVVEAIRQAIIDKSKFYQEYRVNGGDSRITWIVETGNPLIDNSGRLTGFIGTITDVTPLKTAVAELADSEAYRRLIVELEPDCVKVLDHKGRLVEMNPAGLSMVDADSLDQVRGKLVANLITPEYREQFIALHDRVMAGQSGILGFDIISLKGTRRHLETRAVPLRREGRIVGLLGVTQDVTERQLADIQLRESESRYRELFDTNPVPMCLWNPTSMKFLAVNNSMVQHYGYSREEFLSMSVTDIRPPEDVHRLVAAVDTALTGAFAAGIWRHIKKNGEIIEVNVRSHPVGSGDNVVILAQMADITDQRHAEAALELERTTLRETTMRLNHILTTSPTLLYSVQLKDGNFTPVWISDNVTRLFGYTMDEALDPGWWMKHTHPDDRQHSLDRTRDFAKGPLVDEFRFLHKNGDLMWIRAEARVVAGDAASGMEIVGTWSDITQEHKTRERLRLDAAAFESTRDGVMITNSDSIILSVNRALLDVSGYPEQELLGAKSDVFKSGRHDQAFYHSMWRDLNTSGYWQGEIWNRSRTGEIYPVWLTINTVRNNDNEVTHYVAVYTDISKLKQSEQELHQLAHFDPLTELPNRLLLQSRLEHAVDQAQRRNSKVALIFMDLDDFKKVNDSLGHVVGDELLAEMAMRLQTKIREEDTLARLGGDEFVVLLEALNEPEDAAKVAGSILSSLDQPFHLPSGHDLHVHGSIGISIYPNDGLTPDALLRAADTAMYRAKDEGGDRLIYFTREMSQEVLTHLKVENALRLGLERNEFTLHYQPKAHMESGKIDSAEALLRWDSHSIGEISPVDFIPVAERTGLIVPIGKWVIEAACKQYNTWIREGLPPIHIAVNVSARQFRTPDFRKTIEDLLNKFQVPPDTLILELTESMLMQQPAEASAILQLLKQIGVNIALDDFGTGFSSLAYLTRFPMDIIKIDQSFVGNIESDPSARQIITTIIELADGLKMETVAEGVETAAQETFLRSLGCTFIQGYHLSKPLAPLKFSEFMRSWNNPRVSRRKINPD